MEEQDEKPPGSLRACAQVSGGSAGTPRACCHPGPTAQPSMLGRLPQLSLQRFGACWSLLTGRLLAFTHYTLCTCISSTLH